MSQIMKGNPAMKQGPTGTPQILQRQPQGVGVVGGAVANKGSSPSNPPSHQPGSVLHGLPMRGIVNAPGTMATGNVNTPMMPAGTPVPTSPASRGVTATNGQSQAMPVASIGSSVASAPGKEGAIPEFANVANTKEKTPMCLINELARFNKIQHQYTLTDEQGPAHMKIFFVKLKLGDEEYSASGPSIKKAQHAAADIALSQTQYLKPPNKVMQEDPSQNGFTDSITPTVELNALAMKRGEPAIYRPIQSWRPQYYSPPNLDFRGLYNQRYHYPRMPRMFYVSLKVGQREFIGEATTRQSARHNAAEKAMKVLRNLPLPNEPIEKPEEEKEHVDGEEDDELKSEISLVYEIALKRNLSLTFEVVKESGPPHMRTFVTRCKCGQFMTQGEGNKKKLSKKRAAEKMLDELKGLTPLPAPEEKPKKIMIKKKKKRNLIKLQKADPSYGQGINPISRLIQIQQAKKEKEPVYTLLAEKGLPRRREFVMQVTVGDNTCPGVGPNKKLAKRNAAEGMLQLLGYSRPAPQPSKPAIKTGETSSSSDKKVTFLEQDGNTPRQMVPGLIYMTDTNRPPNMPVGMGAGMAAGFGLNRAPGGPVQNAAEEESDKCTPQTTAAIAKELLDTGKSSSPTAESMFLCGGKPAACQTTVRPKQQLLYLGEVLGFQVAFTDFPKVNNKNEYLSLVSLSTSPPQVSHGAGPTIEGSHDMAALTALKTLSELGLDNISGDDKLGAGDGPHIKLEPSPEMRANSTEVSKVIGKTEPI